MRTCLTVLARFIASISAVFFVITTILAILLTTINRELLNASLYKNTLVEQQIYARLPAILAKTLTTSISFNPCAWNPLRCENISPELKTCLEQAVGNERYLALSGGKDQPTAAEQVQIQACVDQYGSPDQSVTLGGSGGQSGMPPFMQNLTAANWETILKIILPPDDLKTMTDSTLDQLFAFLNGETNTVTVSLVNLKERLSGPAGKDIITQLIDSQPPCTKQELAQLISGTSNNGMVLCKPSQDQLSAAIAPLQVQLNSAIAGMPDKAALIKPPAGGSPNPGSGPFGADPIATIRTIRMILRLSPLIPFAFLLMITLFAVRSIKSWLRWWGIPFFISGTIALFLGIAALPVLNMVWNVLITPRIPPYLPPDAVVVGYGLLQSIVHTISARINLQAILLLVAGLAAWIGSTFIKTKTGPELPVIPPAPAP